MGDVNQDGEINIIDVIKLVNYLNGNIDLNSKEMTAAKVCENSSLSILDAVKLINYLNDNAVLPSGGTSTGTITANCNVRLSPNGPKYSTMSEGTSIKILKMAGNQVDGIYWDLVVSSSGVYGYISRGCYQ